MSVTQPWHEDKLQLGIALACRFNFIIWTIVWNIVWYETVSGLVVRSCTDACHKGKEIRLQMSYHAVWFSLSDKNITYNGVLYIWEVFWTKLLFIARFLLCRIFVCFYPWNKACFNDGGRGHLIQNKLPGNACAECSSPVHVIEQL